MALTICVCDKGTGHLPHSSSKSVTLNSVMPPLTSIWKMSHLYFKRGTSNSFCDLYGCHNFHLLGSGFCSFLCGSLLRNFGLQMSGTFGAVPGLGSRDLGLGVHGAHLLSQSSQSGPCRTFFEALLSTTGGQVEACLWNLQGYNKS